MGFGVASCFFHLLQGFDSGHFNLQTEVGGSCCIPCMQARASARRLRDSIVISSMTCEHNACRSRTLAALDKSCFAMAGLGRGSRTPFKSMTAWLLTSARITFPSGSGRNANADTTVRGKLDNARAFPVPASCWLLPSSSGLDCEQHNTQHPIPHQLHKQLRVTSGYLENVCVYFGPRHCCKSTEDVLELATAAAVSFELKTTRQDKASNRILLP